MATFIKKVEDWNSKIDMDLIYRVNRRYHRGEALRGYMQYDFYRASLFFHRVAQVKGRAGDMDNIPPYEYNHMIAGSRFVKWDKLDME